MTAPDRLLVVQPELEDPPGLLGQWLATAGCELDVRRPDVDALPTLDGYRGLVILGGAMSANDDETLSWIAPVKQLVRSAVAGRVPTLGVCLGHQLVATALGGEVAPNPLGQQVGLYPVGWTGAATTDPLFGALATPRRGVQWNDDLVSELPAGAEVLARTERGEIQVVRYAEAAWGVQLHPEVDAVTVASWASETEREGLAARGVDTDALLAEIDAARAELDSAWRPLAERFAMLVAGSTTGPITGSIT